MKLILLAAFAAISLPGQKFDSPCYSAVALKYAPAGLPNVIPAARGNKFSGYQVFVTIQADSACLSSKFVTVRLRYRNSVGVQRFRQDVAPVTTMPNGRGSAALLADIGFDSEVQAVDVEPVPFVDVEVKQ